jgi:hypothetical protein
MRVAQFERSLDGTNRVDQLHLWLIFFGADRRYAFTSFVFGPGFAFSRLGWHLYLAIFIPFPSKGHCPAVSRAALKWERNGVIQIHFKEAEALADQNRALRILLERGKGNRSIRLYSSTSNNDGRSAHSRPEVVPLS